MKMKWFHKKPSRLTLKGWAAMEDLRRSIDLASKEGNWSAIPDLIFQTIELSKKIDRNLFWVDVVETFNRVLENNAPTKRFPILFSREKSKPMPWEYTGRAWYFWLNLFSKAYGWDKEKVSALDIDEAIGLYQEIIIDEQLEKEWGWGLSEVSYEYDKTTKKSRFKPMPRPDWMRGIVREVKIRPISKSAMPVGEIINLDEQKQG